jgi:hypothetical protein
MMSPFASAIKEGRDLNQLGALKSLFSGLGGSLFLVKAEAFQNGDGRHNLRVWYDAPAPLEQAKADELKAKIAAHIAPVQVELIHHPVEKRDA